MKDNALISVRGLEKSFGKDIQVLKGIDIDIFKGDVVVVLGPSGSGKSTFLRCLNRLEEPTGGHVFFEGTDITDPKVNINVHRQKMGMVFQQFNLFPHKTVIDNLTMAPVKLLGKSRDEAKKDAMDLLERVGLAEKANAYPNQLSGGQKQRIAIAGILAMQPQCIVLDEPTAMLDPNGRDEVMTTLLKLNREKNMTVVLITHYMEEAVLADRVVVMDAGKILTQGTPEDVFSQAELLKKHRLDVPQATELAYRLRGCGVKFDKLPLNAEQCVKMLEEVLS